MKFSYFLPLLTLASMTVEAANQDAAVPERESSLTLGIGVGTSPKFMGSKENQTRATPLFDYQHKGGFFASTSRGLGWTGGDGGLRYSLAVSARPERNEKDDNPFGNSGGGKELQGMGDVKASAVAVAGIGIRLGDRVGLNVKAEVPVTQRENGAALRFGASFAVLKSPLNTVAVNASLNYGDRKYLQTYFGVTTQQSLQSGYSAYTPSAGLYKAELGFSWNHQLTQQWTVTAMAGATHLLGNAGRSPLAGRKTAPQGGVLFAYTY